MQSLISHICRYKKWLKCSCSECVHYHKWWWNSEASKKENTQQMRIITLTSDTCTIDSCIWASFVDFLYNQWRNLEVMIHFLQRERCVYYSSFTLIGVQPNSSVKDTYLTNVWSETYPSHWYCLGILQIITLPRQLFHTFIIHSNIYTAIMVSAKFHYILSVEKIIG